MKSKKTLTKKTNAETLPIKNQKKISIKTQYKTALAYLKESKFSILFITMLFIISILTGFLNADELTFIDFLLKDIIDKTIGLNTIELIFFILQNNLQTSFIGFASGIFLGISPFILTLFNGIVIGYVIEMATETASAVEILKAFVPHGIFELPAILISLGLGLKFGFFIFAKDKAKALKERFFNSMNVFLFIILPLLIIAAIIEGLLIYII